jgi:hypothetical protein
MVGSAHLFLLLVSHLLVALRRVAEGHCKSKRANFLRVQPFVAVPF